MHGSLFDVICTDEKCDYTTSNHSAEPVVPGLATTQLHTFDDNISGNRPIPPCLRCHSGLLRPGVVWFGEKLSPGSLEYAEAWLERVPRVDLMLVVGTQARVFPAAEFIHRAARKGARIVYFSDVPLREEVEEEMDEMDFFVQGNVAQTLPELVRAAFGAVL